MNQQTWVLVPLGAPLWQRLIALAILAVLGILALRLVGMLQRRLRSYLLATAAAHNTALRIGNIELVSALRVRALLLKTVDMGAILIRLTLGYAVLSAGFGFFPRTSGLAWRLLKQMILPLGHFAQALVDYLPSGMVLVLVVFVTRSVLKVLSGIFASLAQGEQSHDRFDPDWAEPTYTLVRLGVLAFALVLAFPYLPGAGSEAFKAVGLFVGVLVSLGGSGTVGNVLSGAILTYARTYRVGDVVKLGEDSGVVVHRGLLTTRLRSFKDEEIVVANATVMAGRIVNYSAQVKGGAGGLRLHTTVSIGYATPWPEVHACLLEAARRSEGILKAPAPFVLQSKLDDFYVVYELNAHTLQPERMLDLYDALHRNIQDTFAEAGIEIMSPHIFMHRDGHGEALPGKPPSRGFRMEREP